MLNTAIATPPSDSHNELLARAGVLNFRTEGCGSLMRGLEDIGFTVLPVDVHHPATASCNLLIAAVDGISNSACDAVRALRGSPQTASIPLLVMAMHYDKSADITYVAAGAVEFLSQPSSAGVLRAWCERILHAQRADWLFDQWVRERRRSSAFDRVIVPLGLALFAEKDYGRLLEMILLEAKGFCVADGGTLYVRTPENQLAFMMVHNDTLGISEGGSKGPVTRLSPLNVVSPETGLPQHRYIAAHVALTGQTVNLPDVYGPSNFDLSGTKEFDVQYGYRTRSVLAVPLKNRDDYVIGVIQLINARDPIGGDVRPFDVFQEETIVSLAKLAASGLESYQQMQALRQQIQALNLEIDEVKKQSQVTQITDSSYFKDLKERARALRAKAQQDF